MKSKKTIEVEKIKVYANSMLARTDKFATVEFKAGIAIMIELILMSTNNYRGFQYNYWNDKGYKEWHDAGEPNFPEKDKYIYGPKGKDNAEYDRTYY